MTDLFNMFHFLEDKKKISIYLSTKLIALAKKSIYIYIYIYIYFLFLEENIRCRYSLETPHRCTSMKQMTISRHINVDWTCGF